MDFYRFNLDSSILGDFDENLQTFYFNVLEKEGLNTKKISNISAIKNAIREVTDAYRKETLNSASSSICFDCKAKRCAYVFKYSACFTSVFAHHFLELLRKNPSILEKAMTTRVLNICSLGGGPASDAVAISRIINAIQKSVMIISQQPLILNIAVIDKNEHWEITAKRVLMTLEKTPYFFNGERMGINFYFEPADLTHPVSREVEKILNEADIVTMVKFISAVSGSQKSDKCGEMVQEILKYVKTNAILFYLDGSGDVLSNGIMQSVVDTNPNLKLIYGPKKNYLHLLSLSSMKMFIKLYSKRFNALLCISKCVNSVSAWMKTDDLPINRLLSKNQSFCVPTFSGNNSNKRGKNFIRKRKSFKLKKITDFQEKVRLYLNQELGLDYVEFDSDESDIEILYEHDKILFPTKNKSQRLN